MPINQGSKGITRATGGLRYSWAFYQRVNICDSSQKRVSAGVKAITPSLPGSDWFQCVTVARERCASVREPLSESRLHGLSCPASSSPTHIPGASLIFVQMQAKTTRGDPTRPCIFRRAYRESHLCTGESTRGSLVCRARLERVPRKAQRCARRVATAERKGKLCKLIGCLIYPQPAKYPRTHSAQVMTLIATPLGRCYLTYNACRGGGDPQKRGMVGSTVIGNVTTRLGLVKQSSTSTLLVGMNLDHV